jgi:hypothetical protein
VCEPINVYEYEFKPPCVKPNPEFKRKRLCTHSVTMGLSCGHQCTYCSTPALVRTHPVFQAIGHTAFARGIAIIDPHLPERLAENPPTGLTPEDVIQVATITDACGGRRGHPWSSEHARKRKQDLEFWKECLGLRTQQDLVGCQSRVEREIHQLRVVDRRSGKTTWNRVGTLAAFCPRPPAPRAGGVSPGITWTTTPCAA